MALKNKIIACWGWVDGKKTNVSAAMMIGGVVYQYAIGNQSICESLQQIDAGFAANPALASGAMLGVIGLIHKFIKAKNV